ncbi:hypothetical protein Tco_0710531 [Tanacetum coccineum]
MRGYESHLIGRCNKYSKMKADDLITILTGKDHMEAKDCCLMGLRKKRCGANWNEGVRALFIVLATLKDKGTLWKLMKVVLGVVVAAAEVGQQGHHVASFETKK